MRKINPDTLRKLNLSLSNPDLVKDVSPNELAEMVVVVLSQVKVIEQAIKDGRLNGTSPVEGKDFVGRSEATKMLTDAVNSAVAGFDSKMAKTGSQLEKQVQAALANIRSGDNGIVTEEEIGRAARMALELIELPDFEAMVQTEITTDGFAVRDALELLNGDDKLEQSAVKDLKEDLAKLWDEVQKKSAGNGVGGTSKPAVYRFIKDAIADGIIGGGSSLPDQSGNNGKFLSTDGTDASWETVSAGSVDVVSNVATDRILGRTTAGTGDSEQLTASEVRTLINVADGATANTGALADLDTVDTAQIDDDAITNAKIAGAGTRDATTFYRGDGTFAAPSGSGDLVGPSSAADNSVPTYDGTTGKLVQDQGSMFIDDDGNVGIGTDSPASPLTIANAATNKAQFGTGTVNSSIKISNRMEVGYNGKGYISTPIVKNMEIRTNSIVKQIVHTTGILTSGTNYGVQFTPTVNQASGTAGFTALHVDVTETATGSGSQLLMDLQVGGSSKFVVDNAGNVGIGTTAPDTKLQVAGAITQQPLSSDPADPDAGNSVQWVSDGTGTGDAGDVMLKVNVGGTTKVITLIDYSVA